MRKNTTSKLISGGSRNIGTLFKTNYSVPDDTPIIALSDIHADMDALIITFRDCAKIIAKNKIATELDIKMKKSISAKRFDAKYAVDNAVYVYKYMNVDKLSYDDAINRRLSEIGPSVNTPIELDLIRANNNDILLEGFLNINLDVAGNMYNDDLGYDWIGTNTHVVIIGDILDGKRIEQQNRSTSTPTKIGKGTEFINQYNQVEIKILRFLNVMDEIAERYNGRVFKLVGNHEISNFAMHNTLSREQFIGAYAFGNSNANVSDNTYYTNQSRSEYFKFSGDGFELFRKRGTGVILKINNNIFIHGSLVDGNNNAPSFQTYININNSLNDLTIDKNILMATCLDIADDTPGNGLWSRIDGDDVAMNRRFSNNDSYCIDLNIRIEKFCTTLIQNDVTAKCDKKNIRLIVGHCPQNYISYENSQGRTFNTAVQIDGVSEEVSGGIHEGVSISDTRTVFGISMECTKPDQNTVYRVDVGQSRGFDVRTTDQQLITNPGAVRYLFSRTPQILYIKNDKTKIIRSLHENTRRHQPRDWLEIMHERAVSGSGFIQNGGYYRKTMKYLEKIKNLRF